jgi:arylsulfatase A-like enzyme/predicted Zn-dependent protease
MGVDLKLKKTRTVVCAVVAIAVGSFSACGQPELGPAEPAGTPVAGRTNEIDLHDANVLLITLDTTRADHLGSYGYAAAETPRLDELAADGVLFENAMTPTAFTLPSHSSIMTGLYPPFHGVRLNGGAALADVQTTLAERLGEAGYRTGAVVGAFVLDQRWGLAQGFEVFDDQFDIGSDQKLDLAGVQRPGNRVVDKGLAWLEQPDHRPFFAWLHFYDPHNPYDPPEPFRSRFEGVGTHGLYDGEIAFTDTQVGRLLDWLDHRGLIDETVVVVVGDHGESLGDHGEKEHGFYIYDATIRVPLIIRVPGAVAGGARVAAPVRTIDILPTVLDLVGIEPPTPLHGESLVPLMVDPRLEGPSSAYSESMAVNLQFGWSALYSLRTADHRFVDAPRSELYDHGTDPEETENLVTRHPGVAAELQAELNRIRNEIEIGAPEAQEANLDQETLGMLAALGYVGGASAAVEGAHLADPKDKIHLFESVAYGAHLMTGEHYDEAAKVFEIVLDADPAIPQAKLLLATAYQKTDRVQEAKVVLDDFLKGDPDNTAALISMAKILSEEDRIDEVLALARRVLSVDDRNTQAWELVAEVHMSTNDHQGAVEPLKRVVKIQPKLTRPRLNLAVANIGLGNLQAAEGMLRSIIEEHPKFPLAHFHLGLLYEEQRRFGEARTAYTEEVALHETAFLARFNLGNLYFSLGDLPAADREMRILIEQAPEMPRPHLLQARVFLKQEKDLSEVERFAKTGLDLTDDDRLKVLGYYLLADVYSRQGRQTDLDRVLERAQYHRARVEGAP